MLRKKHNFGRGCSSPVASLCSFFAGRGRHQALGGDRHQTFWRFSGTILNPPSTKHPLSRPCSSRPAELFAKLKTLLSRSMICWHGDLLQKTQFATKFIDKIYRNLSHHLRSIWLWRWWWRWCFGKQVNTQPSFPNQVWKMKEGLVEHLRLSEYQVLKLPAPSLA